MMTPFSENALKITKDDFEILKLNFEIFFLPYYIWEKTYKQFFIQKIQREKN